MKVNKATGAPTRYRVVKEETGLSKKGTTRHLSRPTKKKKKSSSRVHVPSATSRPRPLSPGVFSSQARSPTSSSGRRSSTQNNSARDSNTALDIDESSFPIDDFQEAHYNACREEYERRPGEQLVLHPQQNNVSQDPYIYRPEETALDKVLSELDKFDLYDTIDAISEVVGPKKKAEPVESPASKAAGSWRSSLEQRPPILTSHRDAYSYQTRGQQALSPKARSFK